MDKLKVEKLRSNNKDTKVAHIVYKYYKLLSTLLVCLIAQLRRWNPYWGIIF